MRYKHIIVAGLSFALIACSTTTSVTGSVADQSGKLLSNVNVRLSSGAVSASDKTNSDGEFSISIKETCVIICAGGNPDLTIKKSGYKTIEDYVPRFERSKRRYTLKLK